MSTAATKFQQGFRATLANIVKGESSEMAAALAAGEDADMSFQAGVYAGESASCGWSGTYLVGRHHGVTRELADALEAEAAAVVGA